MPFHWQARISKSLLLTLVRGDLRLINGETGRYVRFRARKRAARERYAVSETPTQFGLTVSITILLFVALTSLSCTSACGSLSIRSLTPPYGLCRVGREDPSVMLWDASINLTRFRAEAVTVTNPLPLPHSLPSLFSVSPSTSPPQKMSLCNQCSATLSSTAQKRPLHTEPIR